MARSTTTTSSSSSLLLFFLSSLLPITLGAEIKISNAQELIELSNSVSSSTTYSGTTVLLDSDLDFSEGYSEQFIPIGYYGNPFNGIFDGQGHTISNLKVNSSSQYVGLFGYSEGTTIQNVVIDGYCSFVNSHSSSLTSPFTGSTIGYCVPSKRSCIIESVVNMASVSFEGSVTNNLFIGGIVGYINSINYPGSIKNCVNYGPVTHSGKGDDWVELGGIAGYSQGQSESFNSIQNCLNYGTITHSGSSKTLAIGGIVGVSYYTTFENCVNSGVILTYKESKNIGGIVGYISSPSEIIHCFWTSDAGNVSAFGVNASEVNATDSSLVTLNQATLDELNKYAPKNSSWSKWVMLDLNGGRINNISQESLVEIQKHFPDPVREGNSFLFWCKDAVCTEVFDPKIDPAMSLYAGWAINTVTFELENGTVVNESFPFNTTIEYPKNMVREGYTFGGWDSRPEFMPAMDITIRAQWTERVESRVVEVVFETKEAGSTEEEEIREILKAYTDEEFVIEKVEIDPETGETKVIIKFVDSEKACEFVRVVNENKRPGGPIKIARSTTEYVGFSSSHEALSLFSLILLSF